MQRLHSVQPLSSRSSSIKFQQHVLINSFFSLWFLFLCLTSFAFHSLLILIAFIIFFVEFVFIPFAPFYVQCSNCKIIILKNSMMTINGSEELFTLAIEDRQQHSDVPLLSDRTIFRHDL